MVDETGSGSAMPGGSIPKWIWIPGLVFTALLLVFLLTVFFVVPTQSPDQRDLLHILIPFTGGFAALFMGGTIMLHLDAPKGPLGKFAVSATGGIALFLFLYLEPPFWFKHETASPVPKNHTAEEAPKIDRTDLRITLDEPKQDVPILQPVGTFDGSQVFCEAVSTGVMVSHNQAGDRPIRLKRVSFVSEPVDVSTAKTPPLHCEVDSMHLKPHGPVDVGQYYFTIKNNGAAEGRYTREKQGTIAVDPANMFKTPKGTKAFTLTPQGNDAQFQFDARIYALAHGLFRVRFHAAYDIAGEELQTDTAWLYLYKK